MLPIFYLAAIYGNGLKMKHRFVFVKEAMYKVLLDKKKRNSNHDEGSQDQGPVMAWPIARLKPTKNLWNVTKRTMDGHKL